MLGFFKSMENIWSLWYKPTRIQANDSTIKGDKVCKPIRLTVDGLAINFNYVSLELYHNAEVL